MKKFILNADDFGKDVFHNDAILEGYKSGILKSASIMANMTNFFDAIENIVPLCPDLDIGLHLNIVEGKALNPSSKLLCNKQGFFKNGYLSTLLKSGNKEFLKDVEKEFRLQIELGLKHLKINHIDSHVHIHSIPAIFDLTAKLADEYNIPYIRLQAEKIQFINDEKYYKYLPINLLKCAILNYFSIINKQTLTKYNVKSNDYLLGVLYTGLMDEKTILEGLKNIKKDKIIEIIIHPSKNMEDRQRYSQYEIFLNEDFLQKIKNLEYEIVNYAML